MSNIRNKHAAHELLTALAHQLASRGASYELGVVGGSALLALDLGSRSTRDVDVVAIRRAGAFGTARPLPTPLLEARARVARDFDLPDDWLNDGPADLVDFGLPEGFEERATRRGYGEALTVWYASRFDQIHFKLYATVDQGPGRHEADLRALQPSEEELLAAARWTRTHDPSEGYRVILGKVLRALGVEDAAERA